MTIVNGLKSKIILLNDLDRKDEVERNKELEAEWEKLKKEKMLHNLIKTNMAEKVEN